MTTYAKIVQVVTSVGVCHAQLNGVAPDERLTPKLARQALRLASGNDLGGLVSDGQTAYRVYAKSVRKLHLEQERTMDRLDGADLYQLFAQDAAFGDIAEQPLAEIVEGIAELRAGTDCDIPMSDWEIAVAIQANAQEHARAIE